MGRKDWIIEVDSGLDGYDTNLYYLDRNDEEHGAPRLMTEKQACFLARKFSDSHDHIFARPAKYWELSY